MAMGWPRKMDEPSQLLLHYHSLLSLFPFLSWDEKEPIRSLCGFQWLSKQGPLHQAWPQCPGMVPICNKEGLGGKLNCCPESDNRMGLKSYFKGPKGARVGARIVTNGEENFGDQIFTSCIFKEGLILVFPNFPLPGLANLKREAIYLLYNIFLE